LAETREGVKALLRARPEGPVRDAAIGPHPSPPALRFAPGRRRRAL